MQAPAITEAVKKGVILFDNRTDNGGQDSTPN